MSGAVCAGEQGADTVAGVCDSAGVTADGRSSRQSAVKRKGSELGFAALILSISVLPSAPADCLLFGVDWQSRLPPGVKSTK